MAPIANGSGFGLYHVFTENQLICKSVWSTQYILHGIFVGRQAHIWALWDNASRSDPWSGSLHLLSGGVSRACEPGDRSRGQAGVFFVLFCFFSVKISEKLYQIDIYTERKIKPLIAFKIILLVNF